MSTNNDKIQALLDAIASKGAPPKLLIESDSYRAIAISGHTIIIETKEKDALNNFTWRQVGRFDWHSASSLEKAAVSLMFAGAARIDELEKKLVALSNANLN